MASLKSALVPRLLVIFTIGENFRKFPCGKFPENLQLCNEHSGDCS